MIFITGDTHGDWKNRFKPECFPIGQSLNRSDYVIVCGDFGYWHDTDIERNNLDWLESQPWTTLFVDGNHSNFDRLKKLPIEEWNDGKVHKIRPHIIHLMRGQVFTIDGKNFLLSVEHNLMIYEMVYWKLMTRELRNGNMIIAKCFV